MQPVTYRSTQPSIPDGWGLKRGVVPYLGWQVTLCVISYGKLQLAPRSCATSSVPISLSYRIPHNTYHSQLYHDYYAELNAKGQRLNHKALMN